MLGGITAAKECFNPHPAREPGATRPMLLIAVATSVSILTRPVSRVQPCAQYDGRFGDVVVSILTRPVSRVQPSVSRNVLAFTNPFQSSPGP